MELAVRELREGVLIEAFRSFALSRDDELIVLNSHANIFLGNPRKDCSEGERLIVPSPFHHRAEGPTALAARRGAGGQCLPIEVVELLVDRATELVQRLSNIIGEECAQHKYLLRLNSICCEEGEDGHDGKDSRSFKRFDCSQPLPGASVPTLLREVFQSNHRMHRPECQAR